MTAEELFKQVGYVKLTKDNLKSFIDKDHPVETWELTLKCNLATYLLKTDNFIREISFDSGYAVNVSEEWEPNHCTDINLDLNLLKAIDKQLKEFRNENPISTEERIEDLNLLLTSILKYKEQLNNSKITIKNAITINRLEDWCGRIYSEILSLKKEAWKTMK